MAPFLGLRVGGPVGVPAVPQSSTHEEVQRDGTTPVVLLGQRRPPDV